MNIPGPQQAEAADLTAMHDHMRQRSLSAHKVIAKQIWQAMYDLGAGLQPGGQWMTFGIDADIFGSPATERTGASRDGLDALVGQIPRLPRYPLEGASARSIDGIDPDEKLHVDVAIVNSLFNDVDLHAPQRRADRAVRDTGAILASVASTRRGGITVALVSDDWLDLPHAALRERVDREADLLGAIRLPAGTLREGAGTDRPVDLLLLRRRTGDVEPPGGEPFMSAYPVRLDGREVVINEYFDSNPEHVVGRLTVEHTPWFRNPRTTVVPELPSLPLHLEITLGRIVQRAHRRNLAIPIRDDAGSRRLPDPRRDPAQPGQGVGNWLQAGQNDTGLPASGGDGQRERRRRPSIDPPLL